MSSIDGPIHPLALNVLEAVKRANNDDELAPFECWNLISPAVYEWRRAGHPTTETTTTGLKVVGKLLNEFYVAWPLGDDWYHDDGTLTASQDGSLVLDPEEEYEITEALGFIAWQGEGERPLSINVCGRTLLTNQDWDGGLDLVDVFEAWKREKDSDSTLNEPGHSDES